MAFLKTVKSSYELLFLCYYSQKSEALKIIPLPNYLSVCLYFPLSSCSTDVIGWIINWVATGSKIPAWLDFKMETVQNPQEIPQYTVLIFLFSDAVVLADFCKMESSTFFLLVFKYDSFSVSSRNHYSTSYSICCFFSLPIPLLCNHWGPELCDDAIFNRAIE